MRELQTTEGILKDQRDVHIVVKGSSNASSKKKKNNFGNTKSKSQFKSGSKKNKGKDKSFLCEKNNH